MGVPCWQARWQREPAAFKTPVLSDPVTPLLGMDPKEVIKGSNRDLRTRMATPASAKGKGPRDDGIQPTSLHGRILGTG